MKRYLITACFLQFLLADAAGVGVLAAEAGVSVTETAIDAQGPRSPWGNAVGDINGDGRPDVIVGGHSMPMRSLIDRVLGKLGLRELGDVQGELVWYENPDWEKHQVSTSLSVRTDLAIGDIDNDGRNDIVVLADQGVFWMKNPAWTANEIFHGDAPKKFHDVEIADLDRDGDLDLVLRNQSLFGYDNGNLVYILIQAPGPTWRKDVLEVQHGEGLKVADIDGDDYPDIIVNDIWLKNPGSRVVDRSWEAVDYTAEWNWSNVYIDTFDINSDGYVDILLSPSEPAGGTYRLSWFEAPTDDSAGWTEHVVEDWIETVHHSIGAGDFDGDDFADIFSAKMNQGADPDEVKVYLNAGDHVTWNKVVLGESGSHGLEIADLDGDWDVEAVGTNWEFDDYSKDYPVTKWDYSPKSPPDWQRFVIGDNGIWRNLFVYVADLDGDGLTDIVAGRSWFKNPGDVGDHWIRYEFGRGLRTALLLHDFDGDGDKDVLGSAWDSLLSEPGYFLRAKAKLSGEGYPGSGDGGKFAWARNDGQANFRVYENIDQIDGDFLQGIAVYPDPPNTSILLSWHKPGNGVQQVRIPDDPLSQTWSIRKASDYSQDEQLSIADLNLDGSDDVVTGTSWIDPARGWAVNRFHDSSDPPDRHVIVDMDSDGVLDVLVGFEAISRQGKLAWYSSVGSPMKSETRETIIDYPIGPMSLSATDMDDDGDIDVIVGEHDLEKPWDAKLVLYRNRDGTARTWKKIIISRGDEHHCGALPVDVDGDGDKDIVSIGWEHSNIIVYQNLRVEQGAAGR